MKEDYLWDKTGDDPGIRGLEQALAVLRYREDDPPTLPAAYVAPFVEPEPGRWFWPRFVLAGFGAIVIAMGVWFALSKRSAPAIDTAANHTGMPESRPATVPQKADDPFAPAAGTMADAPGNMPPAAIHQIRVATPVRRRIPRREHVVTPYSPVLTSEEKYAYGQLMLALSITGSKLKVVQDTINRVDDTKKSVTDK